MRANHDPNAAAAKIFGSKMKAAKTYLYAIPALHRYSEKYNREVGHISTGDRREDAKMMNEPVHVGGSIEDILRLYREGAPITFRNKEDIVDIYDTLGEHIKNWVDYTHDDPNVKDVPMDSLQLMQEFMDLIHPQVRGFRPGTEASPLIKRRQMLFGAMSRDTPVITAGGIEAVIAPAVKPKTNPMMDRLNELLEERNRK